jgi:plastocyanin
MAMAPAVVDAILAQSVRIRSKQIGPNKYSSSKTIESGKGTKTMTRKNVWVAGLAMPLMIALLLLAGSPSVRAADQPPAANAEVKIDNFSFGPQTVTVPVGATVTWVNRDDIPHTVVSTDGVFKSKVRDTDETFSYTFTKAGTYPYFCSVHPKMTGKVVVQ